MIRKFIFAAVSVLLLTVLSGCGLGTGIRKQLADHQEGIRQEPGELWDAFLEEAGEWPASFAAQFRTILDGKGSIAQNTSVTRNDGVGLCAVYLLTAQSGETQLYHMDDGDEIILADASEGAVLTIHAGRNFIVLDGTHFAGSLTLAADPGDQEG